MIVRFALTCFVVVASLFVAPARADAQWYFANYFGDCFTSPTSVFIDQASRGTSLQFHDVTFDSRAFHSPQYYGARVGRMFPGRRVGVEFEFIHDKVISRTMLPVRVTGTLGGSPVDATLPMNFYVDRYSMTHGLNFLVVNLVGRVPIGSRQRAHYASLVVRGGVGGTRPGVDTSVRGVSFQHYEWAGFGADGAAGLDLHVVSHLSAVAEYKVTFARPTISVDGGKGHMTALTQQIAFGFAIGFSR